MNAVNRRTPVCILEESILKEMADVLKTYYQLYFEGICESANVKFCDERRRPIVDDFTQNVHTRARKHTHKLALLFSKKEVF